MTIEKFVDGLTQLLDKEHKPPAEFRWFAPRLILHQSELVRSQHMELKYNTENKPIDQGDTHPIHGIPMKKAKMIDCKKFYDLGCDVVMKVPEPLPSIVSLEHMVVRSLDASHIFDYVRWEDYEGILKSRFEEERTRPYYSLKSEQGGMFLYILNSKVKIISVEAIFHSIIEPYLYPTVDNIDNSTVDYRKFRFPMAPETIQGIQADVYRSILEVDRFAEPEIIDNEASDVINQSR